MSQKYKVTQQSKLLEFLFTNLKGWSKKTVKQRLKGACVSVNEKIQTKHDFTLLEGDMVEVDSVQNSKYPIANRITKLEIIHQNDDLIAINKPAGLLSVATAKESKNHALALLRTQLNKGKESIRLWPVHRLDRDTSGILLFATSKEMREQVMSSWDDTSKTYLAIVEGILKHPTGTITQPMRLDHKINQVIVGKHHEAKPAITHYKLKQSTEQNSLLEINIDTGRQHQIRAHMQWLGHSVIGDERYGTKGERMGLHATKLSFTHPKSNRKITLEVDAPREFYGLMS